MGKEKAPNDNHKTGENATKTDQCQRNWINLYLNYKEWNYKLQILRRGRDLNENFKRNWIKLENM